MPPPRPADSHSAICERRTVHVAESVPRTQQGDRRGRAGAATGSCQPAEFIDGPVTEAVRAQLAGLPAAQERPGTFAIAIRLAQLLDSQTAVPQYASAAKVLTEILSTLSKHSTRRTRLSAVRSMTVQD